MEIRSYCRTIVEVLASSNRSTGGRKGRELDAKPFVMILDDDLLTVEMYRAGLEYSGFRAAAMTEAQALLDAVEKDVPDAVVLDWQLGGMTGGDVLERLRGNDHTIDLPVFMLSNFSADFDGAVDRAFAAGAIAWLTKVSTPPAKLAERLREALAGRELRSRSNGR